MLRNKKNRGWEGYSSKSHWNLLFYTLEKSVFIIIININTLRKRITERKEIK